MIYNPQFDTTLKFLEETDIVFTIEDGSINENNASFVMPSNSKKTITIYCTVSDGNPIGSHNLPRVKVEYIPKKSNSNKPKLCPIIFNPETGAINMKETEKQNLDDMPNKREVIDSVGAIILYAKDIILDGFDGKYKSGNDFKIDLNARANEFKKLSNTECKEYMKIAKEMRDDNI